MKKLLYLLVGSGLACAVVEASFSSMDEGAFPHVNFYLEDPVLGTRLIPETVARFRFPGNPTTTIHTNAQGFRGSWEEKGEILVVGDSQVFGLGVEDSETLPAELEKISGKKALNGGVPTYGPLEYQAVIESVLAGKEHTIKHVVLVLNMANDLFELERPNRERHQVLDGWAVRRGETEYQPVWFPGRSLIFQKSHAVYHARRWWHGGDVLDEPLSLPSEGGASDVVGAMSGAPPPEVEKQIQAQMQKIREEAFEARRGLISQATRLQPSPEDAWYGAKAVEEGVRAGDILGSVGEEGWAGPTVTVEMLRAGQRVRNHYREDLKVWVKAHPDDPKAKEITELFDSEAKALAQLQQEAYHIATPIPDSPMGRYLRGLKKHCEEAGAELTVLVLPLDVQVSKEEWAKYGLPPQDTSDTLYLIGDIVALSQGLGIRAMSATHALMAAEPGAFLYGDLHMSAKGTKAVAESLARALQGEAPKSYLVPELVVGRSRVPGIEEFALVEPIKTDKLPSGCSIKRVREWVQAACANKEVFFVEGSLETLERGRWSGYQVISPIFWEHGRSLTVQIDHLLVEISPKEVIETRPASSLQTAGPYPRPCYSPLPWSNRPECQPYNTQEQCNAWQACVSGSRSNLPECGEGQVNAGSAGWCFEHCEDSVKPCEKGVCTPWNELKICL